MGRVWIVLGGLAGAGAVGMAAVAAHALNFLSPEMLRAVESGVRMQGWHALALAACGVWTERNLGAWRRLGHWAGAAFTLGLLLFCGAVYGLALGGVATGPMAPIGGTLLMLGWLLLAASALRR